MDILQRILGINQGAATIDAALLVLRVAIGVLMLRHGIPKLKSYYLPSRYISLKHSD